MSIYRNKTGILSWKVSVIVQNYALWAKDCYLESSLVQSQKIKDGEKPLVINLLVD